MTFEEELRRFWKPYSAQDRKRVEEVPGYQEAVTQNDIVKTGEIACQILHSDSRQPHWLKNFKKDERGDALKQRAKTPASQAMAKIVAYAIRDRSRIKSQNHKMCLQKFYDLGTAHPEWLEEIGERMVQMGNLSAFNQDLSRAGLVVGTVYEGKPSAWALEIREQVEKLKQEISR